MIIESATNTLRHRNDMVTIRRTVLKYHDGQFRVYLPLALVRIRKQSMGGDTGGCGLVVRVHRTLKTEDVMSMWQLFTKMLLSI